MAEKLRVAQLLRRVAVMRAVVDRLERRILAPGSLPPEVIDALEVLLERLVELELRRPSGSR